MPEFSQAVRFWLPYKNNQVLLVNEMGNFLDFSKFLEFFFQFLKFSPCSWVAVRVLSGVANLASKSHFSKHCSFRDMTFFNIFSKLFSGVTNFAFIYDCSNPCSFRDTTFFLMIFSENFKHKYVNFQNVEDLNPVIGICEGTLRGLRNLPLNMAAQVLVVFEI